ncbi:MAG: flagellar filament capping protein FliD [Kurthia sp.]|nr:flagellar filament capping protein FliD [Candidatus Kurthia equi]
MAVTNTSSTSSASSYSYLQYKNKISGLVSGMDIDSIMEKLMKAESAQMEKVQQQKQKYEWQRDAYREVNTSLSAFEQGMWDNFGLSKNWSSKTVSNTDSLNRVTATAGTSASGTLNISEATLAKAGSVKNTGVEISSTKKLEELGMTEDTGKFKLSGLNEAGTGFVTKEISFNKNDTVASLLSKINSSGAGITAVMSGNSISLTSNATGAGVDAVAGTANSGTIMKVEDDAENIFGKLGFTVTDNKVQNITGGSNGSLNVNGIVMEQASNNYTVAGYSLKVNQNITANSSISISSTNNVDALVSQVKSFVDTYNGLVKSLTDKTAEKKNVNYSPLTDAQKSEMTTDEITKWEEKAKAGLLKGDTTLNSVLSKMRQVIYPQAATEALYKIGVTTTSTYTDGGQLQIDETKLKEALEQDPDILQRLFTGSGDNKGIISELRTVAKQAVSTIEITAGKSTSVDNTYSLGKTIISMDEKITNWQDRLKEIEERYWKQFSAMETAIQKANSQSSLFTA